MITTNKLFKSAIIVMAMFFAVTGCKKTDRPALGDYPEDANPPGGPLKFYAALDERAVDSIRANFGVDNGASYVTSGVAGASGALQLNNSNGYVAFNTANDFGSSTDFTISFWINATMAQKDNNHAVGILAFANSVNFWGNITFYADNNTKSASDSMDLKIHFGDANNGDNWNFAGYNFANAWPKMYDGVWHQVAFTYNATAKVGTVYRDGVQFDQKTNQSIKFENPSKLVLGGFQQADNIVGKYSENTWMAGFPGKLDQVRLYSQALSASEILALYTGKQ